MAIRFLLDEHLRGPLWQAILQHNLQGEFVLDVARIGDTPDLVLGADDTEFLLWAERKNRVLVTKDRRTMATHLKKHLSSGHHCPGVLCTHGVQKISDLVDCLVLIAYVGEPQEFADVVTFVP